MDSVVALFSRQNPDITIKIVYGSSGNFFQQISNAAAFDLFFPPTSIIPASYCNSKDHNRT